MLRLTLTLTVALAVSLAFASAALSQTDLYKQRVDNSSPRFSASDAWKSSSWSPQKLGKDYRYAAPERVSDYASFRFKIPETAEYEVYARWPAASGYNSSAPVGVRTTSGVQWQRVDQTRDGGKWILLGVFELKAGDASKVIFSRWTGANGYVVTDAVRVVEAQESAPEPEPLPSEPDDPGETDREDVLREAESWLGTPYRYGGSSRDGVDCSGLTLRVFEKFGLALPRTAAEQYGIGRSTEEPQPGDLAFGDYTGSETIEHVGVYSGDGQMINAPYPGTVVRYDPIYPKYHVGYRDLLP